MSNIYQEIDTGLRHSKRTCSPFTSEETVTLHHWDGGDIVLETGGIGTVKGRYLRGVNLICQVIDEGVFFYRLNGHGDVVQRVNGVTNKRPRRKQRGITGERYKEPPQGGGVLNLL